MAHSSAVVFGLVRRALVLYALVLLCVLGQHRVERRPTRGQPTKQQRRGQPPAKSQQEAPTTAGSSANNAEAEAILRQRNLHLQEQLLQQQQELQRQQQQWQELQKQQERHREHKTADVVSPHQQQSKAKPPPVQPQQQPPQPQPVAKGVHTPARSSHRRRRAPPQRRTEEGGRVYRAPLKHTVIPSEAEQRAILHRVREMFTHGYDSYMTYAFPEAELRPLSCTGGQFELTKIPLVTLIDTLDTLVVLGNYTEFRKAVHIVSSRMTSLDYDVNVSVFETTIRVLGGLLSAHLLAVDPELDIYGNQPHQYDGWLLVLAQDLGERLLPAFRTNTGIPYGTVNLRHGVPRGETEIASTAGAGSLIVEFEALSSLTGDRRYGDAAYAAAQALFDRRSPIGLLGKHIHTKTGRWFESVSGIGSNSDSFYEYLLKAYLLFRRKEMFRMFTDTFAAIKRFVQIGDWFNDVDMFNGKLRRNRVENLAAFWPGMEATLGFSDSGARQLNTFYAVWSDLGFLPEEFDNVQWQAGKTNMHALYPLRPELIESTYHQYRTTGDRSWLAAGLLFLESLENSTRTECGYASVNNVDTLELLDAMPSFFLTETCKYLYLLFDEGNFVHERAYIFSTEAHLFDPMQLRHVDREEDEDNSSNSSSDEAAGAAEALFHQSEQHRVPSEADDQEVTPGVEEEVLLQEMASLPLLPLRCEKKQWWDATDSYDANFIRLVSNEDGSDKAMLASEKAKATKHKQPSPFPSSTPETRKPPPPKVKMSQSDIVSVLSSTATQALFLERRRDLSTLHAALHGRPAAAPDLSIARGLAGEPNARRTEVCYGEDEPADEDRPVPLQMVDVAMGALGEFSVQVFSDGFVVSSKTWGDMLEISNVGQPVMFVRDSNAQGVKTVIGSTDGRVVTCSVSVEGAEGTEEQGQVLWERACSVAAFGPVSLPDVLTADLALGVDSVDGDGGESGGEGEAAMNVNSLNSYCQASAFAQRPPPPPPAPRRWWMFGFGGSRRDAEAAAAATGEEATRKPLAGKVAIARRGECLFEHKTEAAEAGGASALIVINDRDVLFLMSGKRTEEAAAPKRAAAHGGSVSSAASAARGLPPPHTATADRRIPTVMLTKSDGASLLAAIYKHGQGGVPAKVTLRMTSVPQMLDVSIMGHDSFPKLRMRKTLIYVYGRGVWGAVLTSQTGTDWQLFIMSRADMDVHFAPGNVLAEGRNGKKRVCSAWPAFTINPAESYFALISQQCPTFIAVDDSTSGPFGGGGGEGTSSTVILKSRVVK